MNPFNCRKPITDPRYFKGRREEIEEIGARLNNFHNISIVGQRRIGKTAFLRNLEYLLKIPEYILKPHFVYFDCEGYRNTEPKKLYSLLISKTIEKTGGDYREDSFEEFKDLIEEIITETGKGIIYLFDEFEGCIENRYRDELLPQLRDICTNIRQVSIVTATKKGLFEAIPKTHPTSPFFGVFSAIPLQLLKEEEAKSIIIDYTANTKVSLAQEAETILELAGYHPFFIQLLSFLFFEAKMRGRIDYYKVKEKFFFEAEEQFESYWNELSNEEKDCLYQGVESGGYEDERIIRKLKQKALLDENKEGKPKIFSTAFLEFVRKRFKEEDKMEKRQDISQHINITDSSGVTIFQTGQDAYFGAKPAEEESHHPFFEEIKGVILDLSRQFQTHYSRPDEEKIKSWLGQFETPKRMKLALRLLQHITYIDDGKITDMFAEFCSKISSANQGVVLTSLGGLEKSSAHLIYLCRKASGQANYPSLLLKEIIEQYKNSPEKIIILFVDDNIGSGKQSVRIFQEWLGIAKERLYVKPLNSEEISWLKKTKLCYFALIGFEEGMENLKKELTNHGLSIEIYPGIKTREDIRCFQASSGIFDNTQDREEAKKMAYEIGYQLLSDKDWPDELRKERALGYGNSQKLMVFQYNTPTCTLPILWKSGKYNGKNWIPLFPRRE